MHNTGMNCGCARVSTGAQDLTGQLAQLKAAPAVDRLSRDTTDLLVIARQVQQAGAGIRSLAEPFLDTTSDFRDRFCDPWCYREARTPPHLGAHGKRPRGCEGEAR